VVLPQYFAISADFTLNAKKTPRKNIRMRLGRGKDMRPAATAVQKLTGDPANVERLARR